MGAAPSEERCNRVGLGRGRLWTGMAVGAYGRKRGPPRALSSVGGVDLGPEASTGGLAGRVSSGVAGGGVITSRLYSIVCNT